MVQNFLQPRGSLKTQTNIDDIKKQYAQMFANQQLQQQEQARVEAGNPLRQTVNDLLQSKLLPVEIPQYATIQDIIGTPKGNRAEAFGRYLNTPMGQNLIGAVTGLLTGGRVLGSPQDDYTNYLYGDMNRKQAIALNEIDLQNQIARELNKEFNEMDIADKKLKADAEQFAQTLALDREQLAEMKRHNQAMEANAANKINVGGGANGIKMIAADRKALTENKTTISNIEAGLKALEENPNAYQWYKGVLGADITNRIDPKGVATRTQIDNITAVYRKWLTGAQMSDKERKAYERFLPAPTDNYNIVKAKLEGMKDAVERSNEALLSNYGVTTPKGGDPLGLGL